MKAACLHGELNKLQRQTILAKFRAGDYRALVRRLPEAEARVTSSRNWSCLCLEVFLSVQVLAPADCERCGSARSAHAGLQRASSAAIPLFTIVAASLTPADRERRGGARPGHPGLRLGAVIHIGAT